jgi:hypothetical protein
MWNMINSVGNAMGAIVERIVPESALRHASRDQAQAEFDAAEQRVAQQMTFGAGALRDGDIAMEMHTADNNIMSPLHHFVSRLIGASSYSSSSSASDDKLLFGNPVVYHSKSGKINVFHLERNVYLVNAKLDNYYRPRLEQMLFKYDMLTDKKSDASLRNDSWLIQSQMGRWSYEQECAECAIATNCEYTQRIPMTPFDPRDWVLYTRGSSLFIKELGVAIACDPLFDAQSLSAQDIGGCIVSFPVVAFLCGIDQTFLRENAAPDVLDMSVHISIPPVTMVEESSTGQGKARRHFPNQHAVQTVQSVALDNILTNTQDWITLPVWTWAMRYNGMREKRALHTTADLNTSICAFDQALVNCIQRLQTMGVDGRIPEEDVLALKLLKTQLQAIDRFIGAIDTYKETTT